MTPLENILQKSNNPQGWSLMLNEECSAVVSQVDTLEDTLDGVYIFLSKLNIYLPTDGYPNDLVNSALDLIDSYWKKFTPSDIL